MEQTEQSEAKRLALKTEINSVLSKKRTYDFSKTEQERQDLALAKARYKNLIANHVVKAKELKDELLRCLIGSKVPLWGNLIVNVSK